MKILTWNIQWGRGVDGRVDLDRCVQVLNELDDIDIICLQEVAVNHPRLPGGVFEDQAVALATRLPGYQACYAIGSDLPGLAGGRSLFGNLMLSRLPLLQIFRHLLPWPADPAVPSMQRVALEAVVAGPSGPLRIITTHLEYYSQRQRMAQVEALRVMHAEACGHAGSLRPDANAHAPFAALVRPASAVFCGDFNCAPDSAEHAHMIAPYHDATPHLCDAWTLHSPGTAHPPSVGVNGAEWPDHPYCCDFFFVSEDLATRVRHVEILAATDASDHQPVLLDLAD
jgi:endonuclease/exonuclease/phosphatase family metal-dependent hydrolase